MRTEYLEEFILLAEQLNFTRVAKARNISVSVLSKHIQALEKECRHRLFERDSSEVSLTVEGKRFYQGISPIVSALNSFMEDFSHKTHSSRKVNILFEIKSFDVLRAASKASHAMKEHHGIDVRYEMATGTATETFIKDGFDALITYESSQHPEGIEACVLGETPWVAIVPKSHQLAGQKCISLKDDLKNHKIIRLTNPNFRAGHDVIVDAFEKYDTKINDVVSIADSFEELMVFDQIEDVLIMPKSALSKVKALGADSFDVLEFKEPLAFRSVLLKKQNYQNKALSLFMEYLETYFASA